MIKQIQFKNFKPFKSWQTLELRPITVLIGKNNTGKSAIAKLPTLIAGSLSGQFEAPVQWKNGGVSLGNNYEDLVYNRNRVFHLEITLTNYEEETLAIVFHENEILEYKLNDRIIDLSDKKTKGFLIKGEKLDHFSLNIDYIGSVRIVPKNNYILSNSISDSLGIAGENAYSLLGQSYYGNKNLFNQVSQWYQDNCGGWKLDIEKVEHSIMDKQKQINYTIGLSTNGLNPINMINTGQGIHQVLPVLVRSFLPTQEPTLILIEEPDTHLHPALHGNLAQRFAESYLADKNKSYLLETHSQNFVLRLRAMVAKGELKKEDIAIYYVDFDTRKRESSLKLIEVNDSGGVEWWPEGVFNETSLEVETIYNAQINHP